MSQTKVVGAVTNYIEQTIYKDQLLGYIIVMHGLGNVLIEVLNEVLYEDAHDFVIYLFLVALIVTS